MTSPAMPSSDIYANTRIWFTKARPFPTTKDLHSQLGCHFEEVKEMLDEITPTAGMADPLIEAARTSLHELAEYLKANDDVITVESHKRVKLLDSIADQAVTGCGVAHVLGMDPLNALHEVNRANWSKFDELGRPIYDPVTHKVIKGPNYVEANLTPYV
jgi:predicted HAD superfamily Cof-like phosphohydrolase